MTRTLRRRRLALLRTAAVRRERAAARSGQAPLTGVSGTKGAANENAIGPLAPWRRCRGRHARRMHDVDGGDCRRSNLQSRIGRTRGSLLSARRQWRIRRQALPPGHHLQPRHGRASGHCRIQARATQNLSRFNLDFVGLTVDSITVDGSLATWTRDGGELTVTPAEGLPRGEPFLVVVRYHGIPEPIEDELGISGFIATDDGAVIAGEPHVAATWFPANDHPLDKAAYTFKITVPAGVEAVANGKLVRKWTKNGRSHWLWNAKSRWRRTWPLRRWASSISPRTVTTGFASGTRLTPRSSVSPSREPASSMRSRRRAIRPISVWRGGSPFRPAEHRSRSGSRGTPSRTGISYSSRRGPWGNRLDDASGSQWPYDQDTGFSCPFWHELHPFLTHYQTDNGDGTCSPEGPRESGGPRAVPATAGSSGLSTFRDSPARPPASRSAMPATTSFSSPARSLTTSSCLRARGRRRSKTTARPSTDGRYRVRLGVAHRTQTIGSSGRGGCSSADR